MSPATYLPELRKSLSTQGMVLKQCAGFHAALALFTKRRVTRDGDQLPTPKAGLRGSVQPPGPVNTAQLSLLEALHLILILPTFTCCPHMHYALSQAERESKIKRGRESKQGHITTEEIRRRLLTSSQWWQKCWQIWLKRQNPDFRKCCTTAPVSKFMTRGWLLNSIYDQGFTVDALCILG